MSKKKTHKRQKHNQPQRKLPRRPKLAVVIALFICLGLTTLLLAQWRSIRGSFSPLISPPQTSSTPQLSKEYIYAGSRLIATEESGGGSSPLSPPSSLTATGASGPQVNLSWSPAAGGTVDHYQVERMQSLSSGYILLAPNVPIASYNDTAVSSGSAYLYRVRAVDAQGNFTGYSNIDLATAITFTDDPLQAATTTIKAQHIIELRQAVNAVRTLANLSAATWTNTVQPGAIIRAADVQELRTNLDQARSALSLAQVSYTNQPLSTGSTLIQKAHMDELRQAVK
jgi:hypothetical protein